MNQAELDPQPASPSYRLIPLTRGQFAIVDEEDYYRLVEFNWIAQWDPKTKSFRAQRTVTIPNVSGVSGRSKRRVEIMARVIVGAQPKYLVDHRDHNTLDNRKENLRDSTNTENCRNRKRASNNSSGFKGVSFNKRVKKWSANIRVNKKLKHLGYFQTRDMAADAYRLAATEEFGEFACFG